MKATLHTNLGDIVIDLFEHQAPKTVENFVGLAKGEKEYKDDAGPHQPDPVLRRPDLPPHHPELHDPGRLPDRQGIGGPGYTFDDEISPDKDFTKPYILAMANAGKRMGKGTNGSQFFITTAATTWLQGKHTIFGEVADEVLARRRRHDRRRPDRRQRQPARTSSSTRSRSRTDDRHRRHRTDATGRGTPLTDNPTSGQPGQPARAGRAADRCRSLLCPATPTARPTCAVSGAAGRRAPSASGPPRRHPVRRLRPRGARTSPGARTVSVAAPPTAGPSSPTRSSRICAVAYVAQHPTRGHAGLRVRRRSLGGPSRGASSPRPSCTRPQRSSTSCSTCSRCGPSASTSSRCSVGPGSPPST